MTTKEQEPARAAVSGAVELEAELRAGLEGTTRGLWTAWGNSPAYIREDTPDGWGVLSAFHRTPWEVSKNAAHIARCSPDNIATLLDTIATLRSDNERLGRDRDEAVRAVIKHANDTAPYADELGFEITQRMKAEAERDTLRAEVKKLREVLERIAAFGTVAGMHEQDRDERLRNIARAALPQEPSP